MIRRKEPVDVISMCSCSGQIQPLRLRMSDEHSQKRIFVDRIMAHQEIRHVGDEAHIFICSGRIQGKCVVFELEYQIRSHRWSVIMQDFQNNRV